MTPFRMSMDSSIPRNDNGRGVLSLDDTVRLVGADLGVCPGPDRPVSRWPPLFQPWVRRAGTRAHVMRPYRLGTIASAGVEIGIAVGSVVCFRFDGEEGS